MTERDLFTTDFDPVAYDAAKTKLQRAPLTLDDGDFSALRSVSVGLEREARTLQQRAQLATTRPQADPAPGPDADSVPRLRAFLDPPTADEATWIAERMTVLRQRAAEHLRVQLRLMLIEMPESDVAAALPFMHAKNEEWLDEQRQRLQAQAKRFRGAQIVG